MLRFFRQIRKTLMEQNKIRTYLLYALGEILLVVIGILLALQINNWNQDRINKKLEYNYLTVLKQEIQGETGFLNRFYLDRASSKMEALNLARDHYQGKVVIHDSVHFVNQLGFGAMFSTQSLSSESMVFEEIINTGNLNVISNEELRRKLVNYYSMTDLYKEGLKSYSSGYIQFINSLRPFNPDNPDFVDLFDAALVIKHAKTEEFYTLATGEITYAYQAINFVNRILDNADEVLLLIDKNLENF